MDILMEWLGYIGRWGHILAAITWIGTSFYFNWLDLSERPPKSKTLKPNVVGEVHEIHGGSFYYHERFWPTEDNPRTLAHSGPAQLTFLTGLFLMFHIYWLGADVYLVDTIEPLMTPLSAIMVSALILVVPWLIYDFLCKSTDDDTVVLVCMIVVVTILSYLSTWVFSPRAAFVHVGSALGTAMAANVYFQIIPNHIKMRKQVKKFEPVNLNFHKLAKRRSQHNNYMTLPVLFSMVSVHFPLGSANNWSWLILVLVMGSGFTIRHYRNIKLATDVNKPSLALLAFCLLCGGIALSYVPPTTSVQNLSDLNETDLKVYNIIQTRCSVCHAAVPTQKGFASAPGGVRFETLAQILVRKDQIYTQTIAADLMPPGNLTKMTNIERAALGDWLSSQGAAVIPNEE